MQNLRKLFNWPQNRKSGTARVFWGGLFLSCILLVLPQMLHGQEQPTPAPDEELPVQTEEPATLPMETGSDSAPETPLVEQPQAPEFNPDSGLLAPRATDPVIRPAQIPPQKILEPVATAEPTPTPTPALQPNNDLDLRASPFRRAASQGSQTTGETLSDGVGRTPNPLGEGFLASNGAYTAGFPLGPLTVRPVLGMGVNYRSQRDFEGKTENESLLSVFGSVDVLLGEPTTGNVLTATYSGNLSIGDNRSDPYTQSLGVRGSLSFAKLKLGFGLQFAQLNGTNRDFGEETNRELFTLSLTSSYQYSEKTWFDWDIVLPVRHFEDGQSSLEITSTNAVNYVYSPKTTVGAGFTLGSLALDKGDTQKFAQVFTRIQFSPSEFLSTNATVGVEARDAGGTQSTSPVFSAGVTWRPRLGTTIGLTGERRILSSAAEENTNYASTSVVLGLTQRLGEIYSMRASIGIEDADYNSTEDGSSFSRHDTFYLGQLSLNAQLNTRWVATVLASYGYNDSSDDPIRLFQSSLLLSYIF